MDRKTSFFALLLVVLLAVSACTTTPATTETPSPTTSAEPTSTPEETPEESHMLYEEAPSKYEYGVYVNMDTTTGDALTDYSVAFNNFADRDAYVIYSTQGLTHAKEALAALGEGGLEALVSENKALKIRSNDGFHPLTESLLSLEGNAFNPEEKETFYYVYVAFEGNQGLEVEKAGRFITPKDGPEALSQYSASEIGAIVPGGGSTSIFTMSSSYSPDYIAALTQGAHEAGVEVPRVAVIETTVGTEAELYDDMYLPDEDYPSVHDALVEDGMEPVYIPLGIDNYKDVQNTKYFADLVRSCHIIFFTGGDQAYYGLALANEDGTPSLIAQAITEVLENGGTLGGSSAGAAAMSGTVLTNGATGSYQPLYWNQAETFDVCTLTSETIAENVSAKEGNNMLYESIGFVEPVLGQDVLLDTHVDARGRIGRLIVALRDSNPTGLAIGIDETAGIRIDGSTKTGTAFGTSGVYIIDAANAVWGEAGVEGGFSVTGLLVHYLTPGDVYDFTTGTVTPAEGKTEIVPSGDPYITEDLFGTDELGTTVISFAHSAEQTVSADVANSMTQPFLSGSLYTFTFEKTADTKCYASTEYFPDPDYFGEFLQTTISGMQVSVANGPSKFDPNAGGDFAPVSAASEDNGYAVGVTFSGPLSIGYEGSNKYFLDCEEEENIPDNYVTVLDANGNVKEQDRVYTFRVDNDTTLRIVLVDGVFFAEGDSIILKTGITSLYGSNLASEATFRLTDGTWVLEFDPNAGSASSGFAAVSAVSESDNEYAVGVTFTSPLSVGYEGNNNYFLDCEQEENVPDNYVAVLDADGNPKEQDRVYTFRIDNDNTLRIVLADDVFFAEGDSIVLKTGITSADGSNLAAETTFRLTDGTWVLEAE